MENVTIERIANEMSKRMGEKIDPNTIVKITGDGKRGNHLGYLWDVYATRLDEYTVVANVYDNGEIRVAIA